MVQDRVIPSESLKSNKSYRFPPPTIGGSGGAKSSPYGNSLGRPRQTDNTKRKTRKDFLKTSASEAEESEHFFGGKRSVICWTPQV